MFIFNDYFVYSYSISV